MSVTISQHPSAISFAGNPVLLMASSNLSGKTFLKVCAEVTIKVQRSSSPSYSETLTRRLSIPTNGDNQKVTFDLSDLLLSALSQIRIERSEAMAGNDVIATSGGNVKYTVKLWDEYLDEYSEVMSTEHSGSVTSEEKIAIPGAYAEMERLLEAEDTASVLGSAKILSHKPDFEAVPVGGKLVVPTFSDASGGFSVCVDKVSQADWQDTYNVYANEVSWKRLKMTDKVAPGLHSLLWVGEKVPPFFFHIIPNQPFATYFEFVNRYGAVESIYTYGRRQFKPTVKQERQVRNWNRTFRPDARYVKRTLQEESRFTMSTGPVSREWAEWFVSEFFVAETAWMYSEKAGDMIPVVIECEDDLEVFNESEAEVLDLQFTVTLCVNG